MRTSPRGFATLLAMGAALGFAPLSLSSAQADEALKEAIASDARTAEQKARDEYRHPYETLTFFGIRPDMTVVELWPFGGWYTTILAPYLKDQGRLVLANVDEETAPESYLSYNLQLQKMLTSRPDVYGNVEVVPLTPDKPWLEDGTADMVLTFRNIHNWHWLEQDKAIYEQAFRALKPGGVLGVVEHRHDDPGFEPKERGQAYVGVDWAIEQIEAAGFKLADVSEVNANPKDTKDHPIGVWNLPPIYAGGDEDREKYEAIGESDRFTLKFVKPE